MMGVCMRAERIIQTESTFKVFYRYRSKESLISDNRVRRPQIMYND